MERHRLDVTFQTNPPHAMTDSTPILSRQAILQANDITAETVPTPEWGGAVRVRMLTGTEHPLPRSHRNSLPSCSR